MKIKHTKEKWNSFPIYILRTIAIVDNLTYIIENGEITGTERKNKKASEE